MLVVAVVDVGGEGLTQVAVAVTVTCVNVAVGMTFVVMVMVVLRGVAIVVAVMALVVVDGTIERQLQADDSMALAVYVARQFGLATVALLTRTADEVGEWSERSL